MHLHAHTTVLISEAERMDRMDRKSILRASLGSAASLSLPCYVSEFFMEGAFSSLERGPFSYL